MAACKGADPAFGGREWRVVAIGATQPPIGAGGKYLTMHFDAATSRVSGFSGCNQYNASYSLHGDSLSFGPAVSTQMACIGDGDSIEHAFLGTLPAITTWQMQDSLLTLVGGGVAVQLREGHH